MDEKDHNVHTNAHMVTVRSSYCYNTDWPLDVEMRLSVCELSQTLTCKPVRTQLLDVNTFFYSIWLHAYILDILNTFSCGCHFGKFWQEKTQVQLIFIIMTVFFLCLSLPGPWY